jgi:hypothetical protein
MILMKLYDSDDNLLECSPFFSSVPNISKEIDPVEYLLKVGSVNLQLKYNSQGDSDQDQFLKAHRHDLYLLKLYNETELIFSGYRAGKIKTNLESGEVAADFYKAWSNMLDKTVPEDAEPITGSGIYGFRNAVTSFIETYMTEGPADIGYPDLDIWAEVRPVESLVNEFTGAEYEFDFAGMSVADALKQICFWGNVGVYYEAGFIVFKLKESTAEAVFLDGTCYADEIEAIEYNPETNNITVALDLADNLSWTPFDDLINNYLDNYCGNITKYWLESKDDLEVGTKVYFAGDNGTVNGMIISKEYNLDFPELFYYIVADMSDVYHIDAEDSGEHEFADFHSYPNPTNGADEVTIVWDQPCEENVIIRIYDGGNDLVRTLINLTLPPGEYSLVEDISDLANGTYTLSYESPSNTDTFIMAISS